MQRMAKISLIQIKEKNSIFQKHYISFILLNAIYILALIGVVVTRYGHNIKTNFSESNSNLKHTFPVMNYTNDWVRRDYSFFKQTINFSKCPKCNFSSCTDGSSSQRNLIIAFGMGKVIQSIPFISTLRSTGSKATVIYFVDDDGLDYMGKDNIEIIKDCGGYIINTGWHPHYITIDWAYGYICAFDFLYRNYKYFDRVIIADLYDVVFQTDPFANGYGYGLTFFAGGRLVKDSDDYRWIENLIKPVPCNWLGKPLICSGVVMGRTKYILQFLDLFIGTLNPNDFGSMYVPDQGIFNYLIRSGQIDNAKIPYHIENHNSPVRHLVVHGLSSFEDSKLGNILQYQGNKKASIIHQTYMEQKVIDSILLSCPRETPKWTDYIRIVHMANQTGYIEFLYDVYSKLGYTFPRRN